VTYAEAMDAVHDAYRITMTLLQLRLGWQALEQLELLLDRLARVAKRDDGRGRRPRASPSPQQHSPDRHA
jgi:hypothetical protein